MTATMLASLSPGLSGYSYTVPPDIIQQINPAFLSSYADAISMSQQMFGLYGKLCPVKDQAPPGAVLNTPPNGQLKQYAVTLPVGDVNVGYLLAHQTAPGAWGLDPNGGPEWMFTPSQPNEPVLNPPTTQTIPQFGGATAATPNPNVTPILAAIADLKASILQALAPKA